MQVTVQYGLRGFCKNEGTLLTRVFIHLGLTELLIQPGCLGSSKTVCRKTRLKKNMLNFNVINDGMNEPLKSPG